MNEIRWSRSSQQISRVDGHQSLNKTVAVLIPKHKSREARQQADCGGEVIGQTTKGAGDTRVWPRCCFSVD